MPSHSRQESGNEAGGTWLLERLRLFGLQGEASPFPAIGMEPACLRDPVDRLLLPAEEDKRLCTSDPRLGYPRVELYGFFILCESRLQSSKRAQGVGQTQVRLGHVGRCSHRGLGTRAARQSSGRADPAQPRD